MEVEEKSMERNTERVQLSVEWVKLDRITMDPEVIYGRSTMHQGVENACIINNK